jgi:SAM-dependent methyltransferase
MKDYVLNDRVYIDPAVRQNFHYSDGDDTENYILHTITHAADLSSGSEELILAIKDWPTLYHLHPKRANLLRPLAGLVQGKDILEIGCGCGAITRYLGELDTRLLALEGAYRRAAIAAERCRDLPNVSVVCDNFLHFDCSQRFDVITLIGVLEYSALYFPGEDPFRAMLEKAKAFLRPGGSLIIAIENKLGLKYWAGAPEDHTGQAYLGVENHYGPGSPATFGRSELQDLLKRSGFSWNSFLYPFPDYKLPTTVVTETGMGQPDFDTHMLLLENFEYIQSDYYPSHFSTSLAGREIEKNGLLADLSNSFLVVAAPEPGPNPLPDDLLAVNYNSQRKKEYQKATSFLLLKGQGIRVHKERIYDRPPDPEAPIVNRIEDEPYFQGQLLLWAAIKIISRNGWTTAELIEWGRKYLQILYSFAQENSGLLDGKYIDLTPFNIIVDGNEEIRVFDQEWVAPEPVPLGYVFFRGLAHSLGNISFFNMPAEGALDILDLSIGIYTHFLPFDQELLERYRAIESTYFSGIGPGSYMPFMNAPLKIRKNALIERDSREKSLLLRDRDQEIKELNGRLQWYIRTYEQRSLLGVIKQNIADRFHRQKLK